MDLCVWCGVGTGLLVTLPDVTTLNDFLLQFLLLILCAFEDQWLSLAC